MKILFTGASSFTGFWFARELVRAGHQVTACFRRELDSYDGVRGLRVQQLKDLVQPVVGASFGDEAFLRTIMECKDWDLLCHHAADVTNYKSPDFDAVGAVSNNTRALPQVLRALKETGCRRIALTGSVFEQREGAGNDLDHAFSPYGLSKGLTADAFRFYCKQAEMQLGKFVIPNPFGPYEEARFTQFLVKNWFAGTTPTCSQPSYVRDNIHVSLLAKAYVQFVEQLPTSAGFSRLNPSGYPESQGAFTLRFTRELNARLPISCQTELGVQTEFPEPAVRINTDRLDPMALNWDESQAWDELAAYYLKTHQTVTS